MKKVPNGPRAIGLPAFAISCAEGVEALFLVNDVGLSIKHTASPSNATRPRRLAFRPCPWAPPKSRGGRTSRNSSLKSASILRGTDQCPTPVRSPTVSVRW